MRNIPPRKRLMINTVVMTAKAIVLMALALFSSRIVLNYLGVEDYGIYGVVGSFSAMLVVMKGGMTNATQRFLTFALGKDNKTELRRVYNACAFIHLFIALSILIVGNLIGPYALDHWLKIPPDRLNAAHWVFQCTLWTVVVNVLSVPNESLLIAHERMPVFAVIEVCRASLKVFCVLLLYKIPHDPLILFAILILVIDILVRLTYAVLCFFQHPETKLQIVRDRNIYLSIGVFAFWNIFGTLASIFKNNGTNVVVNLFFLPAVNAAFAVALQVNAAVSSLSSIMMTASRPQVIKNYAQNNIPAMLRLAYQSIKFCYIVQMVLSVPIFLEIHKILNLWLTQKNVPEYTGLFCILMLVNLAIDMTSYPFMTMVSATGKNRNYQVVVGSILLLNLPVLYLLLCFFQKPWLIMTANIAISLLAMQVRLIMVNKLIPISILNYYVKVILPLLIGAVPICVLAFLELVVPQEWELYRFIFNCTAAPVIIGFCLFLLVLDRNERASMLQMVRRVIFKKSEE